MNQVYNRIESINGNVITVRASGVRYHELAQIQTRFGKSLAQVNKLDGEVVSLQVFAGGQGVSTGDEVRFLGREMRVSFSEDLLGRIFNGSGEPIDKGPALTENQKPIGGPSVNPTRRILAKPDAAHEHPHDRHVQHPGGVAEAAHLFHFGRAVQPASGPHCHASRGGCDCAGRHGPQIRRFSLFQRHALPRGALSRTVMFIHTASDPTVECMMIPDMSLAVAEQFALQDKDVLVLLTDMTNFADAMKEIAITQEQVPSNRGYPGDLYSQLAARYEKAVDFANSGSVTILAVTTMPGDDVTHPVPDNTGYITEGQYYLKGGRIEPFGSLSRLKQNVNGKTRKDHRALMDAMIRLYASYKETLEKKNMGFSMRPLGRKAAEIRRDVRKPADGPFGEPLAGGCAGPWLEDTGRVL